jgi:hypothetical protein
LDARRENEPKRSLREAYLTFESSCGADGLVSVLLLAVVSRRQGAVAEDLLAASDFAEVILGVNLRKHRDDVLQTVHDCLTEGGPLWT